MGGRGGPAVQQLAVKSGGSDDGPLAWNVAGLLADDPGADRIYDVEGVRIDLGEDLLLARPIDGRVRLLRTNRGILAHADLRTALALQCSRCLRDASDTLGVARLTACRPGANPLRPPVECRFRVAAGIQLLVAMQPQIHEVAGHVL